MRTSFLMLFAVLWVGCLDPLVDDTVVEEQGPSKLSPPGREVPSVHDNPVLDAQIDEYDGLDRFVELQGAFVNGEHVGYWDLGVVSRTPSPVWIFGTWDESGVFHKLEDHPVLFDVLPGDTGYSPFWQVYTVEVLPDYNGAQMTSPTALPEALAMGFIGLSQPHPVYLNCAIVHRDVRLDMGGGLPPLEPSVGYYRDKRVFYFELPPALKFEAPVDELPAADVFVLRREGGEPLSEPIRGVDMTGDGDVLDSNTLFQMGVSDPGYTPLWQWITAAIPSDIRSIDSYQDETRSDITDAKLLFDFSFGVRAPIPGSVIAFEVSDRISNFPIRQAMDLPVNLPVDKPEEAFK